MKRNLLLSLLVVFAATKGFCQPNYWTELELSKEIVKNLKIELNPELRMLHDLKMDSYILEGGLSYKAMKYLTVAGYYRFEKEWDYKRKTGAFQGKNSINRLAFDVKSGFEFHRFNISGRIRYAKGLDSETNENEIRYRAKVDYNIKGVKINPFASVELFDEKSVTETEKDAISGGLKDINKIRYTAGLEYQLNKNNAFSVFYRLQDNRVKDVTSEIIGISISHDF